MPWSTAKWGRRPASRRRLYVASSSSIDAYSKARWWMPVCASLSGSSLSDGVARNAILCEAPSFVSHAPRSYSCTGRMPRTSPYHSTISRSRVVLRFR